ncbi:MAG: hypothetical protein ACTHMS_20235 [Jatrophihabitans sp.]|uniref:hypothetical protein n=1 Tax=Jatrophihabitans sp. TaxID=1932789 RepID=UPI003F800810
MTEMQESQWLHDGEAAFERYLAAIELLDTTPLRRRPAAMIGLGLCGLLAIPVFVIEVPIALLLLLLLTVLRLIVPRRTIVVEGLGCRVI